MKKITQHIQYALVLVLIVTGFATSNLQAQSSICLGDDIVLNLTGYTGNIQWKFSQLGLAGPYNNLPGGAGDSVSFTPTITTWFFAEVTDGTCDPFYSDTIEVSLNVPPTADAGQDTSICEGESLVIGGTPAGSGGTAPLSYSWAPSVTLSSSTDENPTAAPVGTTDYVLTVTDANGCMDMDTITVSINLPPDANAGADSTVACGDSLVLNGSANGSSPFAYSWTPASSLTGAITANPTATPPGPTTYVLEVTDANGCVGMDSVDIGTAGGGVSGSDTIMYTGNIVTYTVPSGCNGVITIEAWGAEGGFGTSSNIQPGLGAYQKGDFNLAPGTELRILVGQRPPAGNGGGGGTYVVDTSNAPIIIAGGGGGGSQTTDDNNKQGQAGDNGATGAASGGTGGTMGSGGNIGTTGFQSGAGGGLLTNGANGWSSNTGGLSFLNGGGGGTTGSAPGGFGGGGSGSGYVVGGGGGGYSGGGSGGNVSAGVGGGGGSFNSGTNPTRTSGLRAGNGMIIITY